MGWRSRPVQPTKFGGVLAILIGLGVAIGGVVAFLSAAGSRHDYELLRDSGQQIRGEVIATRHGRESHYRRTTDHYYLTVRFVHGTGLVAQEIEVPPGPWTRFTMASETSPMQCTVLSDPTRADHFTLREAVDAQIESSSGYSMIALLVGLGIGVAATIFGVITYRSAASVDEADRTASNTAEP